MRASLSLGFLLGFLFLSSAWARSSAQCHYRYSVWNVEKTTSVKWISVAKPYGELTAKERGPFDCTPCLEDQAEVALSNGLRFKACGRAADKIKGALEAALSSGDRIETIVAYRAQMSRGPIDRQGNRTELSNHSFGVAVDINEDHNGLYGECYSWPSKSCVLLRAGPYRPGEPLSMTETSPIVIEMKKAGFSWGGKIEGRQKDFMHFSPTGY